MNTPKTGIVYHVVDLRTGCVIKVGSTTRSLRQRFIQTDYKKRYANHFLKEARRIESSNFDEYNSNDPYCSFLWHLAAIEHLEMLKQDTFRKSSLSNQYSPLDQKSSGFSGAIGGKIGGLISGRRAVENGQLAAARNCPQAISARRNLYDSGHMKWMRELPQTKIAQSLNGRIIGGKNRDSGQIQKLGRKNKGRLDLIEAGKALGRKAVESGHLDRIRESGSRAAGKIAVRTGQIKNLGIVQGKKNAESGHLKNIALLGAHTRCHLNRGILSDRCVFCQGDA